MITHPIADHWLDLHGHEGDPTLYKFLIYITTFYKALFPCMPWNHFCIFFFDYEIDYGSLSLPFHIYRFTTGFKKKWFNVRFPKIRLLCHRVLSVPSEAYENRLVSCLKLNSRIIISQLRENYLVITRKEKLSNIWQQRQIII